MEQQELEDLRFKREMECFQLMNRGKPWYDRLTPEQYNELLLWYQQWLDVTVTKVIPIKPSWLN